MTKSDAKRLAIGAVILGAVVAGTAVIVKRRKAQALVTKKKERKLESRLQKVGIHRTASLARIAASKAEVLA